jgi:hypothetical protein
LYSVLLLVSLALWLESVWAVGITAALAGYLAVHWWRATRVAGRIVGVFEQVGESLGLMPWRAAQSRRASEPIGAAASK